MKIEQLAKLIHEGNELRAEVERLGRALAAESHAHDGTRKAAGFLRVERDNARAEVERLRSQFADSEREAASLQELESTGPRQGTGEA